MSFIKPEYIYRPQQIILRAWRNLSHAQTVALPWGCEMRVDPMDDIGRSILNTGVYDLPLTEALWRLTDKGDTALDVGANIGYTTSVLAKRGARVYAFEPHPDIFKELQANVGALSNVRVYNLALSDINGEARLLVPDGFNNNHGLAQVSPEGEIAIECRRPDSFELGNVQMMKLDVEGHELSVLQGAEGTQIRDIIFEEYDETNSPVIELLKSRGYEIFSLASTTFGPVISSTPLPRRSWEPPNFLATLNPFRALARFDSHGWQCLKGNN